MANGNPFYVQPGASFGQGLQSLAGTVQQTGQQMRADEERERIRQGQQEMAQAAQAGDAQRLSELSAQYPELRDAARQAFQFTNAQTEQIARDTYMRALSDPQNAAQYMQEGIQQVSEFGGSPRMMQSDLQMLQQDPKAAMQRMSMGLASVDPEAYQAVSGGGRQGPDIGTFNPRDYTVQSFAEFQETGDAGVLERYEPQRSVDIGGVPHVYDPASGKYRPASVMRGEQTVEGAPQERPITAEDVGESEAEITRRRKQAQQEVESESPEEQRKRREQIDKIQQELSKAQDVQRQVQGFMTNPDYVDALTGYSSYLPAVAGSTKKDALVAFNQLKDTLTLGNLNKMSGVLSESDIQVLSSAASGMEPGMSESAMMERLKDIRSVFEDKTREERRKLRKLMEGEPQAESEPSQQATSQAEDSPQTVNWSDL